MKHVHLAISLLLCSAQAFAANGSALIGAGPVSQSAGGTGVATNFGVTSALHKNPALVGMASEDHPKRFEFSFMHILRNATANAGLGARDSQDKSLFAGNVAFDYMLDEKLSLGIGLVSSAGNGVDYSAHSELSRVQTLFQVARIPLAASYKFDKLRIGIAPFLTYGALVLNEDARASGATSGRNLHSALGFGVQAGVTYEVTDALNIALALTTKSKVTYKDITNFDSFGPQAASNFDLDDLITTQPNEIAVGASFAATESLTVALDYRFIEWANADTYKELGWQNQHVIALGANYACEKLSFRTGLNLANSVITDLTGETGSSEVDLQGHNVFKSSISSLNASAFPAYAKTHITAGVGYALNSEMSIDLGLNYGLSQTLTRAGNNPLVPSFPSGDYSFTGTASQFNATLGAKWLL